MKKSELAEVKEFVIDSVCLEMNFKDLDFNTMNIVWDAIEKAFKEYESEVRE